MKYTVVWVPSAQQRLAAIWLAATDRRAVTAAADRIDKWLAVDPATRGTAVYGTTRELTVPPLGVEFEIMDDDRMVNVLSVWRY